MIDRRGTWRLIQAAFVISVLWYAGTLLGDQWREVQALRSSLHTDWLGVIASGLLVLVSYGVLIATWRATVRAWGEHLGVGDAMRIWFISNLGRYVPGKVWQIGAMGVLAQRAGVSAVAAVGSALVVSLVHVLVGFAVVAATGYTLLTDALPEGPIVPAALVLLAGAVVGAPWIVPVLARIASRVSGREMSAPRLPAAAIWVAAGGSLVAWVLFGVAFRGLAVALLGSGAGDTALYVAVFTLSYLLGFLALFAPGGIGVRELTMGALLVTAGLATAPEAAWLVVASRLWLTVLEVLPGAALLLVSARRPATPSGS